MKKTTLKVLVAGIWITVSEFVRNELLMKQVWVQHFDSLGLQFQTLTVNGILWMVWSFLLAFILCFLLQKFSWLFTLVLAWIGGFAMMWIVMYNLQVLPMKLLFVAIPLSILEVAVAELILVKFDKAL